MTNSTSYDYGMTARPKNKHKAELSYNPEDTMIAEIDAQREADHMRRLVAEGRMDVSEMYARAEKHEEAIKALRDQAAAFIPAYS